HPGERLHVADRQQRRPVDGLRRPEGHGSERDPPRHRLLPLIRDGDDRVGSLAKARRYTGPAMTSPRRRTVSEPAAARPLGTGAWVVLPTYNEAENITGIAAAILQALPGATLLVVDDGSPDGTGRIADDLAGVDARIRVRHRTAKQGLGRAYLDGFGVALVGGAEIVVQMDADWSHDPAALPSLIAPIVEGEADLVIGSRYTPRRRRGGSGMR